MLSWLPGSQAVDFSLAFLALLLCQAP